MTLYRDESQEVRNADWLRVMEEERAIAEQGEETVRRKRAERDAYQATHPLAIGRPPTSDGGPTPIVSEDQGTDDP